MFLFPKSINDMHMSFIIEVGVCNEYKAKEYKARYHNTPTIPIRGTASLVLGMTEETMFINTVRDRRIVTPETNTSTSSDQVIIGSYYLWPHKMYLSNKKGWQFKM